MPNHPVDFSKVDAVLQETESIEYSDLFDHLIRAAEAIKEEVQRRDEYKLLALTVKACSLIFSQEKGTEPLVPFLNMAERRSACLNDFTPEELGIFAKNINQITDFRLQARLADILWLAPEFYGDNSQRFRFAELAVEAYFKFPINEIIWFRGGKEAHLRLLSLGFQTQSKNNFRERLTSRILDAYNNFENKNGRYLYDLASILYKNKLAEYHYDFLAEQTYQCGKCFNEKQDYQNAIACYELAHCFYQRLNEVEKQAEMYKLIADAYENDAKRANPLFGQEYLTKAKAALKSIPKSCKNVDIYLRIKKLDKRIDNLRELAYSLSLEHNITIDISPCIIEAKRLVSGLGKYEAIHALLKIARICDKKELIQSSIKSIRENPLPYACTPINFHRDGRLRGKYHYEDLLNKELDPNNDLVQQKILEQHNSLVAFYAIGWIFPAIEVLHLEHRYSFDDFLKICELSSIIPAGRSYLFAKGLYAGFNYDFVTATHILAPQLENLVRSFLKTRGARTIVVDSETGKEDEKSLNALVFLPEADKLLGENVAFEIRALFCDEHGANIRNKIAHGLVDETVDNDALYIYAWWFIFRLIAVNPFILPKLKF